MIVVVAIVGAVLLWTAFVLMMRQDRRRLGNVMLLGLALFVSSLAIWGLAGSSPLGQTVLGRGVFGATVMLLVLAGLTLPSALVINGAVMWRREGHNLGNSMALLAGLSLLAVIALPVMLAALSSSTVLFWLSMGLFGIVTYLGLFFVSCLTYGWLYDRRKLSRPVDAVVVLGARVIDGKVPALLASRLEKAIEVYEGLREQGSTPVLVPTGGQGPDESVAEGVTMSHFLIEHGVCREDILTEDRARTTRENIVNSRQLLLREGRGTRLVIVTNNYHTLRTAVLSRVLRTDAEVVGSPTTSYYLPSAVLREFAAVLVSTRWWHVAVSGVIMALAIWLGLVT